MGLALRPEPRPKARNLPTRYGARDVGAKANRIRLAGPALVWRVWWSPAWNSAVVTAEEDIASVAAQVADLTRTVAATEERLRASNERADSQQKRADRQHERLGSTARTHRHRGARASRRQRTSASRGQRTSRINLTGRAGHASYGRAARRPRQTNLNATRLSHGKRQSRDSRSFSRLERARRRREGHASRARPTTPRRRCDSTARDQAERSVRTAHLGGRRARRADPRAHEARAPGAQRSTLVTQSFLGRQGRSVGTRVRATLRVATDTNAAATAVEGRDPARTRFRMRFLSGRKGTAALRLGGVSYGDAQGGC